MSVTQTTFKVRKNRYFSEAFKREKVQEILSKKISICELSSLYDIAKPVIYRWLQQYSPQKQDKVKICYQIETEAQLTLYYKEQAAELERIIGKKQIEIDFLNRLIEIASQELKVDIKKNFSTKQSAGFGRTPNKEISI